MKIINDFSFDCPGDDVFSNGQVFQILPNVFNDERGYFSEVLKYSADNTPIWITHTDWIKQINRSSSQSRTVRGCHAQKGKFCQGKLVEALTEKIYDIITDARPDSKTFGLSKIYLLDPVEQNKLWVPRGFLHAFVVPEVKSNAIFQYFCDNVYDKDSEIGINPITLLPKVIELYKKNNRNLQALFDVFDKDIILAEKDKRNLVYDDWMSQIKSEYDNNRTLWYK